MASWTKTISSMFWRNWITMLGSSVTTAAAILIIGLMILGLLGIGDSPYIGMIAFLILPGLFVFGLVLIPAGVIWERRQRRKRGESLEAPYPTLDFNQPMMRRAAGIVFFLTVVNVFIIALATYEGVHYSESVEFCGKVCHSVMEPEHTAYLNSPHARVACVDCHIGPGAPWFVRSKLSGVGQVIAVLAGTYSRPIPTPVENLRPSQDTCEQCHWPAKFAGDRVRILTEYSEDEANTPLTTVLLMHIGGGESGSGGIHSWHIDPNKRTRYYATDGKRNNIALVRVSQADGTVTDYVADGADIDPSTIRNEDMRVMDCIDCHNRPTHIYEMPNRAMDHAMANGRIDTTLPEIKRIGVEALTEAAAEDDGRAFIEEKVRSFYTENYAERIESRRDKLDTAIEEIKAIYSRNVFPHMKVTWGTYQSNLNHVDSPGCFRCHDDAHISAAGNVISQDCTICHTVLAMQEEQPEVLTYLGLE